MPIELQPPNGNRKWMCAVCGLQFIHQTAAAICENIPHSWMIERAQANIAQDEEASEVDFSE